MKVKYFLLIVAIIVSKADAQNTRENDGRDEYVKLAKYLSRDGGLWTSLNPTYDSSQRFSAKEFQLKFFWDAERQMLWDSVTVRFKELDYLTWISSWTWHPQKKVVEYNSYGPEGRLISGITKIMDEKKFVTTDKMYEPDGAFKELKDENFIESENIHSNVSYEMKNGKWSATGTYKWYRK